MPEVWAEPLVYMHGIPSSDATGRDSMISVNSFKEQREKLRP